MPSGTKVYKLAHQFMREGDDKVTAIKKAQAITGDSYMTGKKSKSRGKRKVNAS